MGYGLVDAYAAVLMAHDRYIQDTIYPIDSIVITAPNKIYAGKNVTTCFPQGDVVIPSTSEVHYIAGEEIHLRPGFHVCSGATFSARIGSVSSSSNPIMERRLELENSETRIVNEESVVDSTGHSNIPSVEKVLRNGQLIIKGAGGLYNAHGIKVK